MFTTKVDVPEFMEMLGFEAATEASQDCLQIVAVIMIGSRQSQSPVAVDAAGWLGQRRVAAAVRCWCEQRRCISCGT